MQDLNAIFNELEQFAIVELRQRFAEVLGYQSNSRSRQFLIRKILWGIQAQEHGDISEAARTRALELADDRVLQHRLPKARPAVSTAILRTRFVVNGDSRLPPPGTILTRQYQGREITVSVSDDGFGWQGRKYNSLSALAREITGTRWNGFAFFGLGKGA